MNKLSRLLSILFAFSVLLLAAPVHAAQSNGLGITPRRDYNVQAGKSVTDTLYLSNLSVNQDLQVTIRVIDFGAQNETGAPALEIAENAPQTPWSLKPFLKIPKTFQVAAGRSTYIPITVTVPASQGAGSYYSAIEYTAVNSQTKQQVNIAASSATLLFVTVPGETNEQLLIKQFGTWKPSADKTTGAFKSFYIADTPKEFAYRLQNEGNVAEQPSGSMVIKNLFGRTVKEIAEVNDKKQLVLIGQTRRFETCIKTSILNSKAPTGQETQQAVCDDPGLWPGRYTATMAAYYGLNGNNTKEIQAIATFWYFPTWSLFAFAGIIVVILILGWLIRRAFSGSSRRRYRR